MTQRFSTCPNSNLVSKGQLPSCGSTKAVQLQQCHQDVEDAANPNEITRDHVRIIVGFFYRVLCQKFVTGDFANGTRTIPNFKKLNYFKFKTNSNLEQLTFILADDLRVGIDTTGVDYKTCFWMRRPEMAFDRLYFRVFRYKQTRIYNKNRSFLGFKFINLRWFRKWLQNFKLSKYLFYFLYFILIYTFINSIIPHFYKVDMYNWWHWLLQYIYIIIQLYT